MKNRIVGLLIFLFFIFGAVTMEGGSVNKLLTLPQFLIVIGVTAGLSLMYYKKGIDKNTFLKRVKRYFIFSGYIGTLIAIILISISPEGTASLVDWTRKISMGMFGIVYGYILAFFTDTFIE